MPSRPRVHCPNCESADVRATRAQNLNEFVGEFLGRYCFRCTQCQTRFQENVFGIDTIWCAKCPRCFRMDLTTWSESHYRPSAWMRLRLLFGARRVRCEACRCNFVSFRKRRARYQQPTAQPQDGIENSRTAGLAG
jgi:hypothetical protein